MIISQELATNVDGQRDIETVGVGDVVTQRPGPLVQGSHRRPPDPPRAEPQQRASELITREDRSEIPPTL